MNTKNLFKVFALVILALAFVSCGGNNSPAEIETSMAKQLKNNNLEKAFDIWVENANWPEGTDTKEIKEEMKPMMEKARKSTSEKGGIKSYELISEEISEDGMTAKVKMRMDYENGTSNEQTTQYIKVNDKWKIDIASGK